MNYKFLAPALLFSLSAAASSQSLIVCDPLDKNHAATGIWPVPYLSQNKLCFNIRADSGNTCAGNNQTAKWFSSAVIVTIDQESMGRDDTWFRVVKPTINDKEIEYMIEASRDRKSWFPISHVSINRLSGRAVDWFLKEHGGISYQCHVESPKI
ncbi:hypothetical protein ACIPSX_12520 [Pectobacterium sp. CHL-2024]|uniref:hypothetical protein n=1 Tax=Pectobacterium sp. CHL-2024 TaxID=3377079 RepID=UPI0038166F1E